MKTGQDRGEEVRVNESPAEEKERERERVERKKERKTGQERRGQETLRL